MEVGWAYTTAGLGEEAVLGLFAWAARRRRRRNRLVGKGKMGCWPMGRRWDGLRKRKRKMDFPFRNYGSRI